MVLALVLAAIPSLGAAGKWFLDYSSAVTEARRVAALATAAQSVGRAHGGYRPGLLALIRSDGLLPAGYADGGGASLSNAWGGSVVLRPTGLEELEIEVTGLPRRACALLVERMFAATGPLALRVNGTPVRLGPRAPARTACRAHSHTIVFTYTA